MEDMLMKMVMEAENDRKRNQTNRQQTPAEDTPPDDDEPIDYSSDMPDPDAGNPPPEDGGGTEDGPADYGADTPSPDDNPPADDAGTGEDEPVDYGADAPSPDDTGDDAPPAPEGDAAPAPEEGGGEDAPADYGADAPSPDDAGQGEEAPPPEGEGGEAEAGGEEAPPDEAGGEEGDPMDAPAEDPAPGELSDHDKLVLGFTLERNFIRLYKDIRTYIRKIQEAHRETILASVTADIVITNLEKIRDMTYNYIIFEFDNASYEEALYNFNYIIEQVRRNLQMIRTVKEAEEKANGSKDTESKSSTSK